MEVTSGESSPGKREEAGVRGVEDTVGGRGLWSLPSDGLTSLGEYTQREWQGAVTQNLKIDLPDTTVVAASLQVRRGGAVGCLIWGLGLGLGSGLGSGLGLGG